MITITVFKHQDQYRGFRSSGHAGYAEEGSDIICAAVSALTVNAINSIDELTDDAADVRQDEGYLELRLEGTCSKESTCFWILWSSGLSPSRRVMERNI